MMISSVSNAYSITNREQAGGATCCANWKEGLMLTGTVVAVIGFATTYFAGLTLQAASFAVLGVVSLAAFYMIRSFADLAALADTAADLRKTNQAYQAAQQKLEEDNDELEGNLAGFQSSNAKLRSTVDDLTRTNHDLQEAQKDLEKVSDEFHAENELLNAAKKQLEDKVAALQTSLGDMHKQVQQSNAQIVKLGQTLGVFKSTVTQLDAEHLEIDKSQTKFDHALHEDTQQLADQIQLGQGIVNKFLDAVRKQNGDLQGDIAKLSQLVAQGNFSEARLKELQALIAETESTAQQKQARLEQVARQLADAETTLAAQNKELAAITDKLDTDRASFAEHERSLSQLKTTYAALLAQYQALPDLLEKEVEKLEKVKEQLQKLDDEITAKKAELAKLKGAAAPGT